MKYKIEGIYTPEASFEISVAVGGHSFLVIYGAHVNGGFCCIPNWGIACEMGDPSDTFYNSEALRHQKMSAACAREIAAAIRDMDAAMKESLQNAHANPEETDTSV